MAEKNIFEDLFPDLSKDINEEPAAIEEEEDFLFRPKQIPAETGLEEETDFPQRAEPSKLDLVNPKPNPEEAGWFARTFDKIRQSPVGLLFDAFEWWSDKVSAPLAGLAELGADYITGGSLGSRAKFDKFRADGKDYWTSYAETWKDVVGWASYAKMAGELFFDPTSYLGLGVLGRLPGVLGRALGAADRAFTSGISFLPEALRTGRNLFSPTREVIKWFPSWNKAAEKMWEWIPSFSFKRTEALRSVETFMVEKVKTRAESATQKLWDNITPRDFKTFITSPLGKDTLSDLAKEELADPALVLLIARKGKSPRLDSQLLEAVPDYNRTQIAKLLGEKYERKSQFESAEAYLARRQGWEGVLKELRAITDVVPDAVEAINSAFTTRGGLDSAAKEIGKLLGVEDTEMIKATLNTRFSQLEKELGNLVKAGTKEEFWLGVHDSVQASKMEGARLSTEIALAREGWKAAVLNPISSFFDKQGIKRLEHTVDYFVTSPFKEASLVSVTYDLLNLVEQSVRILDAGLIPRVAKQSEFGILTGVVRPKGAYLSVGETSTKGAFGSPWLRNLAFPLPDVRFKAGSWWNSVNDTEKAWLRSIGFEKDGRFNLFQGFNPSVIKASNESIDAVTSTAYLQMFEKSLFNQIKGVDFSAYQKVIEKIEESPLASNLPIVKELRTLLVHQLAQADPATAMRALKGHLDVSVEMTKEIRGYIGSLKAPYGTVLSKEFPQLVKEIRRFRTPPQRVSTTLSEELFEGKHVWEMTSEEFLKSGRRTGRFGQGTIETQPQEFVSEVLGGVGKRKPGLSIIDEVQAGASGDRAGYVSISYHDPTGNAIGMVEMLVIGQQTKILSAALDKSRGLLSGKAFKAITEEVKKRGLELTPSTMTSDLAVKAFHKLQVLQAQAEGKTIPKQVLQEFPTLKKPATKVDEGVVKSVETSESIELTKKSEKLGKQLETLRKREAAFEDAGKKVPDSLTAEIDALEGRLDALEAAPVKAPTKTEADIAKPYRDRLVRAAYYSNISIPERTTATFQAFIDEIGKYWKTHEAAIRANPKEMQSFVRSIHANMSTMLESIPQANRDTWTAIYELANDMDFHQRQRMIEDGIATLQKQNAAQRQLVAKLGEYLQNEVGVTADFMDSLYSYIDTIDKGVADINAVRVSDYPGRKAEQGEYDAFFTKISLMWRDLMDETAKIAPTAAIPLEGVELPKRVKTLHDLGTLFGIDMIETMPAVIRSSPHFLTENSFVNYVSSVATHNKVPFKPEDLRALYHSLTSEMKNIESKTIKDEADTIVRDILRMIKSPTVNDAAMQELRKYIDNVANSAQMNLKPEDIVKMKAAKEVAQKEATEKFRDFFMTDDPNYLDTILKTFFPFWMYASRILPWTVTQMFKRPVLGRAYSNYMNNTDLGYIPVSPIAQINPFRGSAGNRLRRLALRDYPEYFAGGYYASMDAINRSGFYLGQPFEMAANIFGAILGTPYGAKADISGQLPGALGGLPDLYALGGVAIGARPSQYQQARDGILLSDRYKTYSRDVLLRHEAGISMATAQAALKSSDINITPEIREKLERAIGKAESQGAVGDLVSAMVGFVRMRPQELDEYKKAYREMLAQLRPEMTPARQEALWARGLRPQDVLDPPLGPQEARILANTQGAIYAGITRNLAPARWQFVYKQQDNFWYELDMLRKDRFSEQDAADSRMRSGEWSGATWIEQTQKIQERYVNRRDALQKHYEEQLNVPISLEKRLAWQEKEGMVAPAAHPLRTLLESYFKVKPKETANGQIDWDTFFRQRAEVEETVPEKYQQEFYEEISANMTPTERIEWTVRRDLLKPYWDVARQVERRADPYTRYIIEQARFGNAAESDKAQHSAIYLRYQQQVRRDRESLIRQYPLIGYWLKYFGYRSNIGTQGDMLWESWGRNPPSLRDITESDFVKNQLSYLHRIAQRRGIELTPPQQEVLTTREE